MKKRLVGLIALLALCLGLVPALAFAAEGADLQPAEGDDLGLPEYYDLTISNHTVMSTNAADLTVIEGVDVAPGGKASYDPATNTLTLKDATIKTPSDAFSYISKSALIYTGTKDFTIVASGTNKLQGADDSGTTGMFTGEGTTKCTITLVDGATLEIIPGASNSFSAAIVGDNTLVVNGKGTVYAKAQKEAAADSHACALNMYSNITVEGQAKLVGESLNTPADNTGGLKLHGTATTITLADEAVVELSGKTAGLLGAPETGDALKVSVVAKEGWKGSCTIASAASGKALSTIDGKTMTIEHTTATCTMTGYPSAASTANPVAYDKASYASTDVTVEKLVFKPVGAADDKQSGDKSSDGKQSGDDKKSSADDKSSGSDKAADDKSSEDGKSAIEPLSNYTGKAKAAGFTDLDANDWYMSTEGGAFPTTDTLYLDYTIGKGLMSGYSGAKKGQFGPNDKLSRGMVATIIYRSATGATADTTDNNVPTKFSDVPSGQWYSAAVAWCAEKGIVTGYKGTTLFGPEDQVNREQLAAMISRYCVNVEGMELPGNLVPPFKDKDKISEFAVEGVAFCAINGIVSGIGTTGNFDPQGQATRAQMSKIIAVTARMVELRKAV